MKALLGRIICEDGVFVEEFVGQDPLPSLNFSWVRDKSEAMDFKSAALADALRVRHTYTAPDGRLRFPMVICGETAPVRVFPPMVRLQKTAPEAVFAATERRFEPRRHEAHEGGTDYV